MIVIAAVVIGGIAWLITSGSDQKQISTKETLAVVGDDHVKGAENASVTLIEYLDYECEVCGAYYPVVKRISEEYKDDVKFVVRYFPLPGHKNSMTSALAVEAAGKQGKYWEMHDIVFENQKDWGEQRFADSKIFENYARQIGLDMDRYSQDIRSQELRDRVERDRRAGQRLGITGTPTFFLNGEKIETPRGYENFKTLIQSTISKIPQPIGIPASDNKQN